MLFIKYQANVKKFLFTIFIFGTNAFAQITIGAEETSLANSAVAKFGNALSVFSNPASVAMNSNLQIGTYYSPSPFGLSELSTAAVAACNPFTFANLSAGFSTFGFELFRENVFLISGSKEIEKNIFIGTSLCINQLTIANYGNDVSVSIDAGMIYRITEQLNIGTALLNVNRATYGSEDDQIGSSINFGLQFIPVENGNINLSIFKETRHDESVQIGAAYKFLDYLEIRSGMSSDPKMFTGGIGLKYLFFIFDFASTYHRELSFTHQISMTLFPDNF